MALPMSSGRLRVRELVDLVASSDGSQKSVEDAVRNLYDWQHNRTLASMQLAFAPIAAVVIAVVAEPGSTVLLWVGLAILLLTLVLGVLQILTLNWLSREYAYAARLAVELIPLRPELLRYPDGWRAPTGSTAYQLYADIGAETLVDYGTKEDCRTRVLSTIERWRERSSGLAD